MASVRPFFSIVTENPVSLIKANTITKPRGLKNVLYQTDLLCQLFKTRVKEIAPSPVVWFSFLWVQHLRTSRDSSVRKSVQSISNSRLMVEWWSNSSNKLLEEISPDVQRCSKTNKFLCATFLTNWVNNRKSAVHLQTPFPFSPKRFQSRHWGSAVKSSDRCFWLMLPLNKISWDLDIGTILNVNSRSQSLHSLRQLDCWHNVFI